MAVSKRRLGRGLDALLGHAHGGSEPGSIDQAELVMAAVDRIDPNPYQPRREFDETELRALADSIREHGVLQPVLVRAVEDDRYQLIAGERRLRATLMAGLFEIPARVMNLDDRRVAELAMVENLQREDLGPLEKAAAFKDYLDAHPCTQEELARRLGLDRSTVANFVRLLDLPEEAKEALRAGRISVGHARALLGLAKGARRVEALNEILKDGLNVRQTEALVARMQAEVAGSASRPASKETEASGSGKGSGPARRHPEIESLETNLRERFGTPVTVRAKAPGKGRIIIDFANVEEFERVAALIRGF